MIVLKGRWSRAEKAVEALCVMSLPRCRMDLEISFSNMRPQNPGIPNPRRLLVCNAHTRFVGRPYGLGPIVRDEQLLRHPSHRRLRWWIQSRAADCRETSQSCCACDMASTRPTISMTAPICKTISESGIAVLYGYWQHERYFRDIRESLADELRRAFQIQPHDASGNSVCMHVRRGTTSTTA